MLSGTLNLYQSIVVMSGLQMEVTPSSISGSDRNFFGSLSRLKPKNTAHTVRQV